MGGGWLCSCCNAMDCWGERQLWLQPPFSKLNFNLTSSQPWVRLLRVSQVAPSDHLGTWAIQRLRGKGSLPQECAGPIPSWCPLRSGNAFIPSPLPKDVYLPPVGSSVITVHVTGQKTEAQKGVISRALNGTRRQNLPRENQAGAQHPHANLLPPHAAPHAFVDLSRSPLSPQESRLSSLAVRLV